MATWVTDATALPPEGARVPVAARQRADFTWAVVEAATSRPDEDAMWPSAVRCIGSGCTGRVEVHAALEEGEVRWRCAMCGDDGVVRGWVHHDHDLSDFMPFDDLVPWALSDAERERLLDATRRLPDLRTVIMRASPHPQHPNVLIVQATLEELDDFYTLVEQLTDAARGRQHRELLEGLRAGLSTAMDGF